MKPYLISFILSFLGLHMLMAQVSLNDESLALEDAYYGVLIKRLGSDECLEAYHQNQRFTPASLTKLITTATAIEVLGSDYSYMTSLQYQGHISEDGVLVGDIVIKGSGDPTLGSPYFHANTAEILDVWVEAIRASGIKAIDGAVLADASVFDKQAIPDKWIWEDIGNYYGAGVFGLSVGDNAYDLYFSKVEVGEVAAVDRIVPSGTHLQFESQVVGADNNRDNAYIYGSPWHFERVIRGTIPAGREHFKLRGALANPPLVLADMLKMQLEAKRITVSEPSRVLWSAEASDRQTISVHLSPKLSDIIRVTNKESHNLYAEHLLKTLVADGKTPATTQDGLDQILDFWESKGISTEDIKLYDGSGMSRANLLTPEFVVAVIEYMMTQSAHADVFFQSLATAGVDGTFRYFLDGTPLAQITRGKSGSMSGVRCYAGIIEKSPNDKYVFCLMANNFIVSQSELIKAMEAYLLQVFE